MISLNKLTNLQRFLIILIAFTGALLALIGKVEMTRAISSPVILATVPVDPRSLFQGDYVTLTYEISQVNTTQYFRQGQTIYTVLKQRDDSDIWALDRTSSTLPYLKADEKVIRGTVSNSSGILRVKYGIEAFFVPEDQGQWVQQVRGRSRITVRVLLADDGTPSMDTLLLDGQPVFHPAGL